MTSLIIPLFNGRKIITKEFISSIKEYSSFLDKVIIVDDGSSDGSSDIFKQIKCEIVRNNQNLGFATSVNIGLRKIKSKYVCILNQDCLIPNDWIANAESFLNKNENAAAVSGLILDSFGNVDTAGHLLWSDWVCTERFSGMKVSKIKKPQEVFGLSATATTYRVSALLEAAVNQQVFDESFRMYLEDVDLNIRLRHLNWESWIIPGKEAMHQRGSSNARKELKVRRGGASNYLKIIFKNLSEKERMSASFFCAMSFFWGMLKDPLATTFNAGDDSRLEEWRKIIAGRRRCSEEDISRWICGFRLNPWRTKG